MDNFEKVREYYNSVAPQREFWRRKGRYYHQQMEHLLKFIIPEKRRVLEIGCGIGDLLASVKPFYGVGLDLADNMIKIAQKRHPRLKFFVQDAQNLTLQENFDYIILSDLIGNLTDVQKTFENLGRVANDQTRIIITYYNFLWEQISLLAEKLRLKMPQPQQNWLSAKDIENLLFLANIEVIKQGTFLLLPIKIPILSKLINRYLARLPIIKELCLIEYFIARKKPNISDKDYSVSVIIPARNEAGNIEAAVLRTPKLGKQTEIIFVEGGSSDNTKDRILQVIKKYKGYKEIKLFIQKGIGKGDAVRTGFDKAKNDILMILDADLTTPPEDLPKFYQALRNRQGELVIGNRLVYPIEKQAMRFLNILGNKFFSLLFSFLLDQPIKDTLCGTKVLFRQDYERILKNRSYFGDFDPYGDYDLIFGASKLNLRIVEIPVRYRARTYGSTNISRFKHGWLLLKMVILAARRLKFI